MNTTLNTSKIQNILYTFKDKNLFPIHQDRITRKMNFHIIFMCVDFTVSSPKFIRSEPFDTQNEDISLPDHSALHLDHKYL